MKVLSYELKGNRVRVTTDYTPMPVFAYPVGKFDNFESLVAEVERKIKWFEERRTRISTKKAVLVDSFAAQKVPEYKKDVVAEPEVEPEPEVVKDG